MIGQCQYALKEWSVTIDSLFAGQQILLLRKGGITNSTTDSKLSTGISFFFPVIYISIPGPCMLHSSSILAGQTPQRLQPLF